MPELSGVYDSGPIQPVCKIKENLAIYSGGIWNFYRTDYIEPIPRSAPTIVETITAAGLTNLAANGILAKRLVTILQVNDNEFLHLRWKPLDYVEGVLWEQAGQAKFNSRNIQARVDPLTQEDDPYLATTTFWILGLNRDINLEVRNPLQVAISIARFAFWGYRHILSAIDLTKVRAEDKAEMIMGNESVVKKYVGTCTWLPAEGKVS